MARYNEISHFRQPYSNWPYLSGLDGFGDAITAGTHVEPSGVRVMDMDVAQRIAAGFITGNIIGDASVADVLLLSASPAVPAPVMTWVAQRNAEGKSVIVDSGGLKMQAVYGLAGELAGTAAGMAVFARPAAGVPGAPGGPATTGTKIGIGVIAIGAALAAILYIKKKKH